MKLTIDVETSTKCKGNPFTASGKLISYSQKIDDRPATFNYYTDIEFLKEAKNSLAEVNYLIGFNIKFDWHWLRRYGCALNDHVRVWDCQIAEFILKGQQGPYPSLDECLEKYGLGKKDDRIKEYWDLGIDTQDIPVDELKFYNNLDVELTYKLYLHQLEIMTGKQKRLCYLMGLDLLVLADMEWNGVKFDLDLCDKKLEEAKRDLTSINEELLAFSPHPSINLDSGQQLSCFLFGGCFEIEHLIPQELVYKSGPNKGLTYIRNKHEFEQVSCTPLFKPLPKTEAKLKLKLSNGNETTIYFTNEDVLKQLKTPTKQHKRIIELLLERADKAKLIDTYLSKLPELLKNMEWGDVLHGQYNQVVAATGRLSSSNPNMQNHSGEVDQLLISRYD